MSDDVGWYADPKVPGQSRWWDGSGWTTRTMPVPDASAPAVTTLPSRPVRHQLSPFDASTAVDESTSVRPSRTAIAVHEPVPSAEPVASAEPAPIAKPAPLTESALRTASVQPVAVPEDRSRRWPLIVAIVGGALAILLGLALAGFALVLIAQGVLESFGGMAGLPLPPLR